MCAALVTASAAAAIAEAHEAGLVGRSLSTHPRVVPSIATRHSAVVVLFTLADAAGHEGVVETDYRIEVDAPHGARPACQPPPPPVVDHGRQGTVKRVALPRPAPGWCLGRYAVTVFQQRGPYCPTPPPGERPKPCPKFASRDLDVGKAHFTVRRRRAHR